VPRQRTHKVPRQTRLLGEQKHEPDASKGMTLSPSSRPQFALAVEGPGGRVPGQLYV